MLVMEKDVEKLIQSEFKDRTINPSAFAFEKLTAKIEKHQHINRNKWLKYVMLAASVVIAVFFITDAFQLFHKKPIEQQIISDIKSDASKPIIIEKENLVADAPPIKHLQNVAIKTISKHESIALTQKIDENKMAISVLPIIQPETKLAVINHQNSKPVLFKSNVTDAEINQLLNGAQSKMLAIRTDSLSVNALQLLYEIEMEINKPLPEKVILTLQTGSRAIKDLVKTSNN